MVSSRVFHVLAGWPGKDSQMTVSAAQARIEKLIAQRDKQKAQLAETMAGLKQARTDLSTARTSDRSSHPSTANRSNKAKTSSRSPAAAGSAS